MPFSIAVTDSDPEVEKLLRYLAKTGLSPVEQSFLLQRSKDWVDRMENHHYSPTAEVTVVLGDNEPLTQRLRGTASEQPLEPQTHP